MHRSVRINVVDEARGSKSTFVCDRALLAVSMRYFADHLARRANEDDVSITGPSATSLHARVTRA